MMPASFAAPRTLPDLLTELDGEATILAGGMTIMPLLNRGIGRADKIVSLSGIPALRGIACSGNSVRFGAMATHSEIASDPIVAEHVPILATAAAGIGDVQVRNRGTIGGVAAYGNAGADYVTALTALGARVVVVSRRGSREVAFDRFVLGLRRTDLARDEVIVAVVVPSTSGGRTAFERYFRVQGAAPTITAAAVLKPDHGRLAVGGATPTPVIVELGREFDLAATLDAVDEACADRPFGDAHNPAPYRRAMARHFATRVLQRAQEEQSC
ncbi:FAD binding domain-containing protein [Acrocarpospora pleiomorpha]|nr:FAD binding domain-containing protein [Acrocarpospora pleiomorpha]